MGLIYLALIAACSALALAWPLRTRAGPAHRQHPGRGHAVVVALIRGFVRRSAAGLGNAWLDLTRATGYVLLPLPFLFALFPAGQGVIRDFAAYQDVQLAEPVSYSQQKRDIDGRPLVDATGKPALENLESDKRTALTKKPDHGRSGFSL